MGNRTPPGTGLGSLEDRMRDMERRLRELEQPTGTQRASTLAYLAGLVTEAAVASSFNSGVIPNDATFRWSTTNEMLLEVEVTTGRMLVMVGCSEASIDTASGSVQALASYQVENSSGTVVRAFGTRTARNYLSHALAAGEVVKIGTPLNCVSLMTGLDPGIYTVRGRMGTWSVAVGATIQFNAPFLVTQVV